jgi:hypothetical protein
MWGWVGHAAARPPEPRTQETTMMSVLESIGAQLLGLVVPAVKASAGVTVCEPHFCHCRPWNEICCCNHSGTGFVCWCDSAVC